MAPRGAGGGDGLALDATGCAHLFGGEEAMVRAVAEELSRLGYAASAALADTRGAAWALARYGAAPAAVARGKGVKSTAVKASFSVA